MKDYKRLQAGAVLGNTASGVVVARIVDYDGGDFELSPKVGENIVVLVDPNRPAAYGFQIEGEPEALKRLGNALIKASKSGDDGDD